MGQRGSDLRGDGEMWRSVRVKNIELTRGVVVVSCLAVYVDVRVCIHDGFR